MGSLEEENLFEMVHNFLESEESQPLFSVFPESTPQLNEHHKCFILQEVLGSVSDAENEVLESTLKHMRNKMDTGRTGGSKKWLVSRLRVDGFDASLCHTSWVTTLGCPGGDYEYIDIVMKDKNGGSVRLIVDIDFRSQFELARPTPTYRGLSDALPSIFVGEEHKLKNVISILCSAAKQSLKERGLHVPPWRTSAYMHSKWLSHCHKSPLTCGIREVSRENGEEKVLGGGVVPLMKPKKRDFGGGSALSSQFSNMSTQCC